MARAVPGDILHGFLKEGPQVLNARFKTTVAIGKGRESCAKRHRVAAVPRIINEGIDDSLHARPAAAVVHQFAFSSDGSGMADPRFIGEIAPDR